MENIHDTEDMYHYNEGIYKDYSHHLKMLRDSLLKNSVVEEEVTKNKYHSLYNYYRYRYITI